MKVCKPNQHPKLGQAASQGKSSAAISRVHSRTHVFSMVTEDLILYPPPSSVFCIFADDVVRLWCNWQ